VVREKYPAYIDWETFEKIQAMLRDNRAEYQHIKSRGIPRDGAALLHGITYCGECGHKMAVRYKCGSQYVCNHLKIQRGAPECQNLRAAPIDAQVAAAFLAAVAPAEIDALSKARKTHLQSEKVLRHAEEQQIERLRYQAALAERQFNRADPDNRLVTGELERRWEAALLELRRAEEALAEHKMSRTMNPLAFLTICVPRRSPSEIAFRRCGRIRRPVGIIARRSYAVWSKRSSCAVAPATRLRCVSCGAAAQPLSFWSHCRLMPWPPCRGTRRWWSAYTR
jgi:recombinase-like zinc beta ribbon protein